VESAGDELLMVEFKVTSQYSSGGILEKEETGPGQSESRPKLERILNGIEA
jgi:hypothetical protein